MFYKLIESLDRKKFKFSVYGYDVNKIRRALDLADIDYRDQRTDLFITDTAPDYNTRHNISIFEINS